MLNKCYPNSSLYKTSWRRDGTSFPLRFPGYHFFFQYPCFPKENPQEGRGQNPVWIVLSWTLLRCFSHFYFFSAVSLKATCKMVWEMRNWHQNKKQSSFPFLILVHEALISILLQKEPPCRITERGRGAPEEHDHIGASVTPEELCCSKCGPWTTNMSSREFLRNAESHTPTPRPSDSAL